MRRALVIFLILLFPLNVLALSLSVSTAEVHRAAQATSAPPAPDGFLGAVLDIETTSDLDSDEPPSGIDLHDILDVCAGLRLAVLEAGAIALRDAHRHCQAIAPPLRPPRAA